VDLVEKSCMRKIYLRLLPFAILSYFLAYIDRINVSFAALTMRGDLGISAGEYGFALGTFYWGYFIFEVPSNVILEKVGARLWIARIMITWGILAGLTAIVTGATSFGVVRFFLGVAEAGFFPGIVLYFTYWFPTYHHARIVSGFLIGLPIAVAAGAPISTGLLELDGLLGLKGWQIMYLAEGIPTVIVGILTFFVLTDRPQQATFLTAAEKAWLTAKLASERSAKEAVRKFSVMQGMFDAKVLLMALNYFGIVVASLGILFFVPQIIKSIGVSDNMTVGWLTMIPYISGGIGLVGWGLVSDRMNERRWNLLAAVSAIGLVIAGMTIGTWWAMVGLSIATSSLASAPADALRARHAALGDQLADNPFQRPLHLESTQTSGDLKGDVYAVVDHPFATVDAALKGADVDEHGPRAVELHVVGRRVLEDQAVLQR